MSFEARCPQCIFISNQLGQRTPCLLHLSVVFDGRPVAAEVSVSRAIQYEYDEPYEFGQLRPTVDRPGPFTIREYVRLQLLRTRIQAAPSLLDSASAPAVLDISARVKAHSLSV